MPVLVPILIDVSVFTLYVLTLSAFLLGAIWTGGRRRRNNLSTPPSQIDAHPGRSVPGFAPLDNFPLDPSHSPAIEISVIRVLNVHIPCQTHVVRCLIVPRTDLLRSSNRLPFKPRSRVLQISAHRAQGRHNPLYWTSSPTKT